MDHVVTDNIETKKYQPNKSIKNEPTFHTSTFNSYSETRYPLTVVTVTLRGDKKNVATTVDGLTCLWDSGATDSMINRKHTKDYERNMRSNKVEYITAAGIYCTAHDAKGTVCMSEFSSSKIINHLFHINNTRCESGIGYGLIIGRELMVKLGPTADFKHQVLQWDGATIHMKEPSGLLGKSDLNKRNMRKVVILTAEPASTIEATE